MIKDVHIHLTETEFLEAAENEGFEQLYFDSWKWGHEMQCLVMLDGKPYITQWIQVHCQDGWQIDGGVDVWPAKQETVTVTQWVQV